MQPLEAIFPILRTPICESGSFSAQPFEKRLILKPGASFVYGIDMYLPRQ